MAMPVAAVTIEGPKLAFTFSNGTILAYDVTRLSPEMLVRAAVHGVNQKGRDSYAGALKKGWSVEECAAECNRVLSNVFDSENWNSGTRGGGNVVIAMAAVLNETVEDSQEVWDNATDNQRKAIRADKAIRAELARMEADRLSDAETSLDVTALFAK